MRRGTTREGVIARSSTAGREIFMAMSPPFNAGGNGGAGREAGHSATCGVPRPLSDDLRELDREVAQVDGAVHRAVLGSGDAVREADRDSHGDGLAVRYSDGAARSDGRAAVDGDG